MNILAFESSCDETAVAVVRDGRQVLSDAILSQADMHALYGGVVPEIASRKHVQAITALTDKALSDAGLTKKDIDAVAVTYAPGLIGAVLVGVNFAKAAAFAMNKPLIPVHHIRGHIAANYLAYPALEPPFLCLVVSGGHTMIVEVKDYTEMSILGTSLDDAAGECFDKVARVLGMPYPGGAALDRAAQQGDDVLEQLVPRAEGAVFLGQGDGHAAGLTTGDDGDLMYRVMGRQGVHGDGVTGLVISGELPGVRGHHVALFFRACDDLDDGLLQVGHGDELPVLPRGQQRTLVHQVLQICAGEAAGGFGQGLQVYVLGQRLGAGVDLEHLFAPLDVRQTYVDLPVKATGTEEGWVEDVHPVGGS